MSVNRPLFLALRGFLRLILKAPFQLLKGFRVEGGERLPRVAVWIPART